MDVCLKGKTALVTGGSHGLGASACVVLAAEELAEQLRSTMHFFRVGTP